MKHINGEGRHASASTAASRGPSRTLIAGIVALVALLAIALGVGAWAASTGRLGFGAGANGTGTAATADGSALDKTKTAPKPVAEHHGNSPDCPDTDCISMLVNGDLLFHEGLWEHFAGSNTAATDGTAFNFDPLFAPMKKYIQASDIAVCEFETPIAPRGGPYSAYPIFNIPPEVADAAKHVGYNACTHATNHSWDQGADGIARLWDTLESEGIAQTGSYKTEADSVKPLVIDSPTGGGKLGLVTGTVSLNGMTADQDWQVDRLRESGDPHHDSDIQRAVDKANKAREEGADVVAISMHSVQEYLDDADSWQVSEAHELADTGAFDVIYGAGCHCVQPIEHYNNTWIIYGTGNAVTVTSYIPGNEVNNQGMTARIQFAGKKGVKGSWRVNRIDWLPTANMRQGQYVWCPISSDHPDGTCWNDAEDAKQRQRISDVIYKMGADPNVVREWNITAEQQAKQANQ
ncbi:CapA family protein [Bifidobacterium stellenboschense]|uniref:Metallophosphatase n=1 Tax=Bifidobacterium stellenboschense TaxID=762211 RepID=A0A087DSW9_9BIFI|nr:CapA family protein [Bifidobacterium stellenboschense]KFI98619.1 metallophosphatase [Bifidobacterium stellenboschense]